MSKTVVIVSETGRLINVLGVNKESESRYSSFAQRLLGDDGSKATLNFGWAGHDKLIVSGSNGAQGEQIKLDAEEVVITGDLKVGSSTLQELLDANSSSTLSKITGKDGEISVSTSSGESGPVCTISLDREMTERIESVENTVSSLLKFDEVYKPGDGLEKIYGSTNLLQVKLGTGLKFEFGNQTGAVAVDADSVPIENSPNPITSGAVYAALGQSASRYSIGVSSESGNMVLIDSTADTEGE